MIDKAVTGAVVGTGQDAKAMKNTVLVHTPFPSVVDSTIALLDVAALQYTVLYLFITGVPYASHTNM